MALDDPITWPAARKVADLFVAALDSVKGAPGMAPVLELHRPVAVPRPEREVILRFIDLAGSPEYTRPIYSYEAELLVTILGRIAGPDVHGEIYRAFRREYGDE